MSGWTEKPARCRGALPSLWGSIPGRVAPWEGWPARPRDLWGPMSAPESAGGLTVCGGDEPGQQGQEGQLESSRIEQLWAQATVGPAWARERPGARGATRGELGPFV